MAVNHNNYIHFYRTLNGLSMPKFATLFHKNAAVMRRIEKGEQCPSLDFAVELADFFNVELRELFSVKGVSRRRGSSIVAEVNRSELNWCILFA